MADQERLLVALRNAHAAGDTAAAARLAQLIRDGQGESAPEPAGLTSLIPSSLNRGAAALIDSVANTPTNLLNLGKAAVGAGLYATGNQATADKYGFTDMTEGPSPASRLLAATGTGQARPVTPLEKRVDWMAQAVPATMLSPTQGAANIAKIAGMNALSGLAGGETYERTGNGNAALLASILAPVAAGAVPAVASSAKNVRNPFTQRGRELSAGDFLLNNSANAKDAVAALEATRKPTVPGSLPTTGQVLAEAGDNRVLGYEKQLAEDVAHRQPFDERYAANKAARDAQMRRIAPGDEGAALVQQRVRDEVARRQAAAEAQAQNAAASRDWAMGQAGREVTTPQAGQVMANVYDDLNNQYRQQSAVNYAIDPFNTINNLPLPAAEIGNVIDDVYAGVTKAAPGSVRESLGIVGQIAKPAEGAIAAPVPVKPQAIKYAPGEVNPHTDDILTAIAKNGGLSREEAAKYGFDPAEFNKRAGQGKPVFSKNGGVPFDRMAEALAQDGYPVLDNGQYSPHMLADALDEAMRGKKVMTPQGHEYQAALDDWHQSRDPVFGEDLRPIDAGDLRMGYNQMKVAASRIGELERQSSLSGDSQSAMALGRIKRILRQSMDDAVEQGRISPEIADAYRNATAEYAQYARNMKEGVAGKLQFRNGERGIKLENVPRSFLQSGEEAFRSFQRSIGGDETATATAQDWLSTQWRNSVRSPEGKIKPNWKAGSAKWLTDNAEVLDTYPGLRQRVEYAIAKADTAEGLAKRLDAEMRRLGSGTGAKHFLRDMNPQVAFDRFVKSPNRIEESKLIGAMAKRDPEFKGGLSSAMREHIQGMTDPQLIKFMDNAGNQKLITDLFGDRMLSQWKKIANDARRDQLRTTQNKVAGSNTQSNQAAWRIVSSITGHVPGLGVMQAVAGNVAKRLTAKSTNLKQRAFLDPQVAAGLMKQSAATPDAVTQARTNLGKTLLDFPDIEKRALIIHNLQMQERKRK